ncbi:MAG: hypothetical protein Q4P14_04715, partial [Methanobacteriaceae archaeon]|nr:hypothetical protein [Methanobacteriaceae archaeon]
MRTAPPKVMVSGRVPAREKAKLKATGKNVSHAVHYFVEQISDPVNSLEVDIHFLKEEICDAKLDIIDKEKQLEQLKSALDETKRLSPKYYPEIVLNDVAKEFIRLYTNSDYYKGVSIHDAIDTARQGLVAKVRDDGYDF